MRSITLALLLSGSFLVTASAQSTWDKSYTVNGKPMLQVQVDDASVRVRSCGGCRTVSVQVDYRNSDPTMWSIAELQGGNGINFSMKHKEMSRHFFGGWHGHSPEITIVTPTETDLNLRSGDGALTLAGLHGSVDAHTGDGAISADDLVGAMRLTTGDGSITLRRGEGSLYATTGDGSMNLEGRLNQFEARSGDGGVTLRLMPGSTLGSASSVTTGDGSISINLPRDLRAEVEANTGDGRISSSLPFFTTTSSGRGNSHVRGTMNGGGPTLRIHSGDGSISLSAS
ncbi:DUF4097 domain-containing protein [Terriglobus sp. RCC_193]|uniref:DUF4097 family beta strand repeat-containing protein n=1 Tax=Terriglobus sp. RCC_193 TaxID=3239218 RepID=UPI0035239251